MHGIVSLLDAKHQTLVESLWREFEERFGFQGVRQTPIPHFSYHIAEDYDLEQLEPLLRRLAAATAPFPVFTAGLGLFTGEEPVLYVPITRNLALDTLHQAIYAAVVELDIGEHPLYIPSRWMPHITLAHKDINHNHLPELVKFLSQRDFYWEIEVDNLALIYDEDGQQGVKWRFDFG